MGLGDSGLGQAPQPRSQVGAGFRSALLPVLASSCPPPSAPARPGPSGHIKPSLCQASGPVVAGAPGAAGWGRRAGSCTRGQGTSGSIRGRPRRRRSPELWGWTRGRSGRLPPPLPSCRPAPSPSPSSPATAPAHPCHVKEAEGEPRAERGRGLAGLGPGSGVSRSRAGARTRRRPPPPGWTTPSTQCLDYLFRTRKLYSSLHIG